MWWTGPLWQQGPVFSSTNVFPLLAFISAIAKQCDLSVAETEAATGEMAGGEQNSPSSGPLKQEGHYGMASLVPSISHLSYCMLIYLSH